MVAVAVGAMSRFKSAEQQRQAIEERLEENENAEPAELSPYRNPDNYKSDVAKRYIELAGKCEQVVQSDMFNVFIISVIILAGILVGLQAYPTFDDHPTIALIDTVILAIFTFEILLKTVAEGCAPWLFFTGPERGWNTFDLLIVILSMPVWGTTFGGGNSVKLLRLTRLMRVMKLLKKIPQLQMIVMGLLGGLRSIVYILALLALVFYLYAIVGFYLFSKNDPFHFRSVPISVVTLFRMSTLEDWSDIVYIQYYGCDSEMFDTEAITSPYYNCPPGMAAEFTYLRGITILYCVSFVVIAALVMLSLFVGAVTMSMTESMATMKMESELAERRRKLQKAKKRAEREKESKRALERARLEREAVPEEDSAHDIESAVLDAPGAPNVLNTGARYQSGPGTSPSKPKSRMAGTKARTLKSLVSSSALVSDPEAGAARKRPNRNSSLLTFNEEEKDKVQNVLNVFGTKNNSVFPMGTEEESSKFKLFAGKAIKKIKQGRRTSLLWNPFAPPAPRQEEEERVRAAFKGAWEGIDLLDLLDDNVELEYSDPFKQRWARVAHVCLQWSTHPRFGNFIILVIIIASGLVGVTTEESMTTGFAGQVTTMMDWVILGIFLVEILLKTAAERFQPWRYFIKHGQVQGWNLFDYMVVVGSLVPGSGSMLTMLRLLRLLRVLKLVKSLPALQVIIVALIGGLTSISYIGVILFLVFYVFAILGMILFEETDPWHFGSLHISMLTLLRMATLDDWSDIMYINMYGCDKYGYEGLESLCVDPFAYQWVAAIFFIAFVLLGALVLMTLFIGVVTTSMEQATNQQETAREFNAKLEELKEKHGIPDKTMSIYQRLFDMLDLDGSGTIEEEELRFGLESIGKCPEPVELARMVKLVDEDGSGEIDMLEFVILLGVLQKYNGGSVMYQPDFKIRKSLLVRRGTHNSELGRSERSLAE